MKYYRLLSKVFNSKGFTEQVCRVFNDAGWCIEVTKNIPEAGEFVEFSLEEEKIDNNKIAQIIEERKDVTQNFPSLSVGIPNYLPFSLLQRALRCSAAVCLIRKKYQIKDIVGHIKSTSTKAFPSVLNVISDGLNLDYKFWESYDTVAEAIENEDYKKRIKDKGQNIVWVPIGTGFLVGRNYLLTNNHVLPDKAEAESCIVQFKYEKDESGRDKQPIEYYLDNTFFKTSPASKLDYTLVKLHPFSVGKSIEEGEERDRKDFDLAFEEAGDNFGWLPMLSDDDLILPPLDLEKTKDLEIFNRLSLPSPLKDRTKLLGGFVGESINIVQHPRGRQKEIAIYDNRVQSIYKDFIQYTTDADFGSSGSPVFNARWQLVALHHGILVEYKNDAENSLEQNIIVRGNLGVRINKIVADLEKQEDPETRFFFNEFVNQDERRKRKRKVFILAGRERTRFGEEKTKEAKLTDNIGKKVAELLEDSGEIEKIVNGLISTNQLITENNNYEFEPEYVPKENRDTLKKAVAWIKQETDSRVIGNNYQLGDVAIEIVTNYFYKNPNNKNPNNDDDKNTEPKPDQVKEKTIYEPEPEGATVYYENLSNFKGEIKIHAERLLNSILNNVLVDEKPALTDRGAQPDTAVSNGGLQFCRDLIIPSMVLYVGYWTNPEERQLMQDKKDKIAEGIVKGIVLWSNSLSL